MPSTNPHSNGIITITSITTESVELSINYTDENNNVHSQVEIAIRKETDAVAKFYTTSNNNYTIPSPLEGGKCYVINAKYSDDGSGFVEENKIYFDTTTFTLVGISATSNSIEFSIKGEPSVAVGDWQNWQYNALIKKSGESTYWGAFGDADPPDINDNIVIENLEPDTKYYLYVEMWHYEHLAGKSSVYSIYTEADNTYTVTIYTMDLTITKTGYKILKPDGSLQRSNTFFSSSNDNTDEKATHVLAGIKANSTITISCVPKYEFYNWYVRWGSPNAPLQKLSGIEQTLTINDNLYIRAVGKYRCRFVYRDADTNKGISSVYTEYLINEPSSNGGQMPYRLDFSGDTDVKYIPKIEGYSYSFASLENKISAEPITEYIVERSASGKNGKDNGTSKSFYLYYNKSDQPISEFGAYIYIGNSWIQATPYIYDGSKWVKYTPQIYSNGWK